MDLQKRPLIFSILKNGRFFYLGILYGAWVSRRDPTTRSASPLQGIPCSKHCERAFKYDAKSSDFVDHFDGPRHIKKKKNAALKVQSQGNSWRCRSAIPSVAGLQLRIARGALFTGSPAGMVHDAVKKCVPRRG